MFFVAIPAVIAAAARVAIVVAAIIVAAAAGAIVVDTHVHWLWQRAAPAGAQRSHADATRQRKSRGL
jgi:endonuclease III